MSGSLCVSFKCVDFPGYCVFRWGFVFRLVVFEFRWCRGCAAVKDAPGYYVFQWGFVFRLVVFVFR